MPLRCCYGVNKKIQPFAQPVMKPMIHLFEEEIHHHIASHRQFYNMFMLGKYTLITTVMIHELTERAARIIGILNTLIEECGEERARAFYNQFMIIDSMLYKELHRQFKSGHLRLTAGAMQLLYVQKRIGMNKLDKAGSALF